MAAACTQQYESDRRYNIFKTNRQDVLRQPILHAWHAIVGLASPLCLKQKHGHQITFMVGFSNMPVAKDDLALSALYYA